MTMLEEETIAALGESDTKGLQLFDGDPALPALPGAGFLIFDTGFCWSATPIRSSRPPDNVGVWRVTPDRRRRDGL